MWMKYQPSFKHGLGSVMWEYLGDNPSESVIEDVFQELDAEHGDPEGFRRGKFEVVALPPQEYLQSLIEDKKRSQEYLAKYIELLEKMLLASKAAQEESKNP